MNWEESFNLERALWEWRKASQHQRWAYYNREGFTHDDQDTFYDGLIRLHCNIANRFAPEGV